MYLDIPSRPPLRRAPFESLVLAPLRASPVERDHSLVIEEPQPPPNREPKRSEYRWVVDVLGVAGAIVGGIFFGVPGIIIGGALLATGAVPLRRWLASREDPQVLSSDLSLEGELAVTAGSSLLFGGLFIGATGVARIVGTRLSAAIASRAAAAAARRPALQRATEQVWEPFKEWYVQRGHLLFRAGSVGLVADDLLHDKQGRFDPTNFSLDTGYGFAAALYSGNLVYGRFFGTNPFGLDTAAPLSVAAYQLFRTLAGANPLDFRDFNYNEALRFRYIAEFGNVIQSTATYGRAYWRPDLRESIAASRGLSASRETGTATVSPFGWLADHTLGAAYRHLTPNFVRQVVRPTVHYPVGPLVTAPRWSGGWGRNVANRLTILRDFKNGDMMKPQYGDAGRLLALAQTWGLVVPWWLLGAPAVGMSRGEWGPNRYWKFTVWSLMGTPIKAGLGSDTVAAQAAGFGLGMVQDAIITQFYNPRYKKRHWGQDLHASLARFRTEPQNRNKIATHIYNDIFCRQMTDWSLSQFVAGNGPYSYNDDYLGTWAAELATSTPQDLKTLEAVYQNRLQAAASEKFDKREQKGLPLFSPLKNDGDPG